LTLRGRTVGVLTLRGRTVGVLTLRGHTIRVGLPLRGCSIRVRLPLRGCTIRVGLPLRGGAIRISLSPITRGGRLRAGLLKELFESRRAELVVKLNGRERLDRLHKEAPRTRSVLGVVDKHTHTLEQVGLRDVLLHTRRRCAKAPRHRDHLLKCLIHQLKLKVVVIRSCITHKARDCSLSLLR
jgi:hypothetical protein